MRFNPAADRRLAELVSSVRAKHESLRAQDRKARKAGEPDLDPEKWREQFASKEQLSQEPLKFVVDGFIPHEGVTGIGGKSGHGKTWVMLSMAKAISTGAQWMGRAVERHPVLYLMMECGDVSMNYRLGKMRVESSEDFLVRTMSKGQPLTISSPFLLAACKGRVVFLDTFVRLLNGRDENSAKDMSELLNLILNLLSCGAVAVVFAAHSVKSGKKFPFQMTSDCVFRGSGDITAILSAGFGVYQLDQEKNVVHIENLKARDFEALKPMQLVGRPFIDKDGDFAIHKPVGQCGWFDEEKRDKGPAAEDPRLAAILEGKAAGKTNRQLALELGYQDRKTIERILKKAKDRNSNSEDEEGDF